ncbi:MAG TPA: hypothetical protein VFO99_08095 [Pyrinomonadaceae bacterium]|nr:hypothetical protein [Pyrinomonadaceae bacterium]
MPFTPVQTMPSQPPTVRIFLTGQLMLQPSDGSDSCEVFVNRSAPNHHLTVEVREKRPDKPDSILMRHHGPLEFRDSGEPVDGVMIKRMPEGKVSMYTGRPNAYGESLTTAIDLRSEDFHPANEMAVDFESARPSIMIQDGIFHTAAKTSSKLKIKLKKGETEVRDMQPFASLIGANVYLNQGEFLIFAWREMGLNKTLSLTLPEEKGAYYEIYIINDPLFEDPEEPKAHDEFGEYYKVLPTVPTGERLKLDVTFPQPVPQDKGTTKTPCMPVIISGP